MCEELGFADDDGDDGDVCFVAVSAEGAPLPALVVAQRYSPAGSGFEPGVALPSDGEVVFIGAGERLLAHRLSNPPVRLWEDTCNVGFFCWAVHHDVVVMSAELELAAWSADGTKLWTTFVEPPWSYTVDGDMVRLDVMGAVSHFALRAGPRRA